MPPKSKKTLPIKVPILILWGKKDPVLSWKMAEITQNLCEDSRVDYFDEGGHFIQHEFPNEVNEKLSYFLDQ